ncbi:MAG: glycosyltransferase [Chloroflexi bacterium]|nr:glycosyltransferase [Chloroflexota bacterium]
MKILHVYKAYPPVVGGIENHVRCLAEAQAAAGHDVTVLVTNAGLRTREEQPNGVRVLRAGRLGEVASTPLSVALPRLLARQRPDITHLQFPYPLGEVSQWLCGTSKRCVLTYHSDVVRQKALLALYRPVLRRVLQHMDRILVTSPDYLESSATLRSLRDKCVVVPLGIAQERFQRVDAGRVHALRARYGEGPLLLFAGVLRYYKGLGYLLQAMQSIRGTLIIVGDGPMGPQWRAEAEALGLGARVVFAGQVSDADLPSYYQAADLFVLPSCERSEAFGLVLAEALSAGLPAISTDLGTGTSYVNRHGESGLVVPPRDAAALAAAANTLLDDGDLRQRLAHGAAERARLFAAERMVAAVLQVYDDVLAVDS